MVRMVELVGMVGVVGVRVAGMVGLVVMVAGAKAPYLEGSAAGSGVGATVAVPAGATVAARVVAAATVAAMAVSRSRRWLRCGLAKYFLRDHHGYLGRRSYLPRR